MTASGATGGSALPVPVGCRPWPLAATAAGHRDRAHEAPQSAAATCTADTVSQAAELEAEHPLPSQLAQLQLAACARRDRLLAPHVGSGHQSQRRLHCLWCQQRQLQCQRQLKLPTATGNQLDSRGGRRGGGSSSLRCCSKSGPSRRANYGQVGSAGTRSGEAARACNWLTRRAAWHRCDGRLARGTPQRCARSSLGRPAT